MLRLGFFVAWALLMVSAGAEAREALARYAGMHPLNPHMGAFCYIDVAHVHSEWPPDIRVYRLLANKTQVFVGDPVALGYDGPAHAYFGPHPLVWRDLPAAEKAFCYLRGPHYHANPPQPAGAFVQKDGASWFVGTFPPEFDRNYSHNDWINQVHGIGTYKPPQVDITAAPPGYRLPAILGSPAVVPVLAPPSPEVPAARGKRARGAAAGSVAGSVPAPPLAVSPSPAGAASLRAGAPRSAHRSSAAGGRDGTSAP